MQIGGTYIIDFAKVSKIPKFNVNIKNGDNKRTIKLILLKNNEVLNLNNYTVVVATKKIDGKDIFNDVKIIDAINGKCEIEVSEQMLTLETDLPYEIILYGPDGEVSSSSNFVISRIPSLRDEKSIVSSSEFTALTKALADTLNFKIELNRSVKYDDRGVLNLNIFDENTRNILQGQAPGHINAVLGEGNVTTYNLKDFSVDSNKLSKDLCVYETCFDSYVDNLTASEPNWIAFAIDLKETNINLNQNINIQYDILSDKKTQIMTRLIFSNSNTDIIDFNIFGEKTIDYDISYKYQKINATIPVVNFNNQKYILLCIGNVRDSKIKTRTIVKNLEINGVKVASFNGADSFVLRNSERDSWLKERTFRPKLIMDSTEIQNSLKTKLDGKVLNALGDSITAGYNANNSWVYYLKEKYGLANARNYGVSGSSIAEKPSSDWATQTAFVNRVDNIDSNADFVIVFGGTNDFGNNEGITEIGTFGDGRKDTLYGATHYLCDRLINKYSNARIVFLLPMYRNYNSDHAEYTPNEKGYTLEKVRAVIKEVCYHNGIPCLNLKDKLNINPDYECHKNLFIPDGIHPNDEGQKRIASVVGNFLENLL